MIIIVMGVTGAGKSTLASALAARLGWDFVEGDDYHPPANIEKMRAGTALDDSDRRPWLERLHELMVACTERGDSMVLTCSALKSEYRALLSRDLPAVHFVYLTGAAALIRSRLKAREHHFMLPNMLDSQLAVLEPPQDALLIPVDLSTDEQVAQVCQALAI